LLGKVLQFVRGVWLNGGSSRSPRSRANLAVFVGELESLNQAQVFFNVTANRGIVEGQMSQHAIVVNDVGGSSGISWY
jgi:hypothetical protein